MRSWRERAAAIRTAEEGRRAEARVVEAPPGEPEAALIQQSAFARRVIAEVLAPVLREFLQIVTGTPGTTVCHEYHRRALGVCCELDSRRFSVDLFLLTDGKVRLAVSLLPQSTDGWHRDYDPTARNEEIEEWFGVSLCRLYEAR